MYFVPLLFPSATLAAQEVLVIPGTTKAIHLDGKIDEAAWQEAARFGLVMNQPESGTEASEKTRVYIMYDERYVYVAGMMYDSEPGKIQSPTKKRDDMGLNNDWFCILFDTFHDRENALTFCTSPAGLRTDFSIFNDGQGDFPANPDWNTFWDVSTATTDSGWAAEIRIPISSLRFQDDRGQVKMGMTAIRYIGRKNEWDTFPVISNQWGFWSWAKPSQTQPVVFEKMHSRTPLYIAPYLLAGFTRDHELNNAETRYTTEQVNKLEPGLDVKLGLTSNFTADFTVNTDFAQVEADDQMVNLTRFSLFFPEKRMFFLERSSIFDFKFGGNDRLFYSRRIGIHEGDPVRIFGGARLVGRQGPWDIGFMSMQTAALEEVPGQNHTVLRIRRQVINENTYVGGMMTSLMDAMGGYNLAYGIDGIFRLQDENYMSFAWAQSFQNGVENEFFSTRPARFHLNFENRAYSGLNYDLDFSYAGKGYDPGLGFQNRENYSRFGNTLGYGWIPEENTFIQRHKILADGYLYLNNTTGKVESAEVGPVYSLESEQGWEFYADFKYVYENVPDTFSLGDEAEVPEGIYHTYGGSFSVSTPFTWLYGVGLSGSLGSFYDGNWYYLGISPRWNVSNSLDLSGTYQLNRVSFPERGQEFISHIARLRLLHMLSTKFSVTAFVQYNSLSDGVISNVRIRYNPREGNDLYIVYNETLNTGRAGLSPLPPLSDSRTLMVKYTYTFSL